MVLGKVDPNIVVPPRIVESSSIVVSPTIVESPRRTIFLLDCDVAGLSGEFELCIFNCSNICNGIGHML